MRQRRWFSHMPPVIIDIDLCICYLRVTEGQVDISTLYGKLRVCINSSFFGYFDGLER